MGEEMGLDGDDWGEERQQLTEAAAYSGLKAGKNIK